MKNECNFNLTQTVLSIYPGYYLLFHTLRAYLRVAHCTELPFSIDARNIEASGPSTKTYEINCNFDYNIHMWCIRGKIGLHDIRKFYPA